MMHVEMTCTPTARKSSASPPLPALPPEADCSRERALKGAHHLRNASPRLAQPSVGDRERVDRKEPSTDLLVRPRHHIRQQPAARRRIVQT